MKKITIWISATLAVLALLIAFQLNASGTSGKEGDGGAKQEGVTNDQTGENK